MENTNTKQQKSRKQIIAEQVELLWYNYNNNFLYQGTNRYGAELVELVGRYKDKLAIKIPIEKDDRDGKFKQELSAHYGIDIRKWVFRSDFSLPDWNGRRFKKTYNVYLVKYQMN